MMILYSILGYRDFNKRNDIIEKIKRSKYYDKTRERLDDDNCLKLHESNEQILWLFVSNLNIYIVLDDIIYENIFLQLFISIENFYKFEKGVEREVYGKGTSRFYIYMKEEPKYFLYSTDLYSTPHKLWDRIDTLALKTLVLSAKSLNEKFIETNFSNFKGIYIHKVKVSDNYDDFGQINVVFFDNQRTSVSSDNFLLIKDINIQNQNEFYIKRSFLNKGSLESLEMQLLGKSESNNTQLEIFYCFI